jgi:hypothetical protein
MSASRAAASATACLKAVTCAEADWESPINMAAKAMLKMKIQRRDIATIILHLLHRSVLVGRKYPKRAAEVSIHIGTRSTINLCMMRHCIAQGRDGHICQILRTNRPNKLATI